MTVARNVRITYLAGVGLLVLADQIVKRLIDTSMALHDTRQLIPGLLQLTYVRNRGGAFGLLSNADLPAQTLLFAAGNVLALTGILVYSLRTPIQRRLLQTALHLILAGAIGNLIDRLVHGYVIDFVDVYWKTHHWPMFNVADSAISVGVTLLLLDMLRAPQSSIAEPQGEAADSAAAGRH